MDLIGGATADRLAIGRVRNLRGKDHSIADATSELSSRQLTLSGTRPKVASHEDKQRSVTCDDICPFCKKRLLNVINVVRHVFGAAFYAISCACEGCSYSCIKQYDPTRGISSSKDK